MIKSEEEVLDDFADLIAAEEQQEQVEPKKHTLLEVWTEILSNIEDSEDRPVSTGDAVKLLRSWPGLTYQDIPAYIAGYHSNLKQLRAILLSEYENDKNAFKFVEDDATRNKTHYLNLLANWQIQVSLWEQGWNPAQNDAAIWAAAFNDAANFVIGQSGLVAHLDSINFEYTEDDAAAVQEAIVTALNV